MKTLNVTTVSVPPASPHDTHSFFTFPYPVSYEFQVAEYVDSNDKVVRVELQVKENQHDQFGNVVVSGTFNAVPRIKFPV